MKNADQCHEKQKYGHIDDCHEKEDYHVLYYDDPVYYHHGLDNQPLKTPKMNRHYMSYVPRNVQID